MQKYKLYNQDILKVSESRHMEQISISQLLLRTLSVAKINKSHTGTIPRIERTSIENPLVMTHFWTAACVTWNVPVITIRPTLG